MLPPSLPSGSSRLEQHLLDLIDKSGGCVSLEQVDRALQADLKSAKAKSLKDAITRNMLPNIERTKINKKGHIKRSTQGRVVVNAVTIPLAQPSAPIENRAPLSEQELPPSIVFVRNASQLEALRSRAMFQIRAGQDTSAASLLRPIDVDNLSDSRIVVATDCEGGPDGFHLIQLATASETFVFDCIEMEVTTILAFLIPLFTDAAVVKVFHDMHRFLALWPSGCEFLRGLETSFRAVLDTQLAVEAMVNGNYDSGFNTMLNHFGLQAKSMARSVKKHTEGGTWFSKRPLSREAMLCAVDKVQMLVESYNKIRATLQQDSLWTAVLRASGSRMREAFTTNGKRKICFDVANTYAMASQELMQELRPEDMFVPTPLSVSDESEALLSLLPEDLVGALDDHTDKIADIVLDKGRTPLAWITGKRVFLGGNGRLASMKEIGDIVENLGGFGSDNRAGLERQLHRISAVRNREKEIIGLTMRVGRHVTGNADMISDLLFANEDASILFLGEPGSGKTTIVREATRLLAERCNVNIVDTSNEIAGDGDIPHPCVGHARRMMVPSLNQQSAVMIECVQNHTPAVMVIDEIGRSTEVEAARTCKNRGVRLIASAHGDFRKLIANPKIKGLIGGTETVTLGDDAAKEEAKRRNLKDVSKTKTERAGPPTFEIIVELARGEHHSWRVILDAAKAVDCVLDGQEYRAQRRTRNPLTGSIHVETEYA